MRYETTDRNRRSRNLRMPGSVEHSSSWGLRRCTANGCMTAFTTKRECPDCGNPTVTIAEAQRVRS